MLADKWVAGAVDVLLAFLAVYLFFQYFSIFFQRKEGNFRALLGIVVLIVWQLDVSNIIHMLSAAWNICVTMGITLFAVTSIFEGKVWMKCFFSVTFDAVWMLAEMLILCVCKNRQEMVPHTMPYIPHLQHRKLRLFPVPLTQIQLLFIYHVHPPYPQVIRQLYVNIENQDVNT